MAISIKDPETDRLARALATATGETLTEAIRRALAERLARESQRTRRNIDAEVRRIQERVARLPVRDPRPADNIIGYDTHGAPERTVVIDTSAIIAILSRAPIVS